MKTTNQDEIKTSFVNNNEPEKLIKDNFQIKSDKDADVGNEWEALQITLELSLDWRFIEIKNDSLKWVPAMMTAQ